MAKATIVGRMAVKVSPDTTTFREDLKVAIDRAERGSQINIDARLGDTRQLLLDTIKMVREINEKSGVEKSLTVELQGHINLDSAALDAKVKATAEEAQRSMGDLDLKIDFDDADSIKKAIAQIDEELGNKQASWKVKVDQASLAEARAILQENLEVKLQADRDSAARMLDSVQKQLRALSFNISPKVDQAQLNKTMREIEARLLKVEEIKARITPEMDEVARRKAQLEIEGLQASIEDLKANIRPEVSKVDSVKAKASLAETARDRIVKLIPEVSKAAVAKVGLTLGQLSGLRLISREAASISNVVQNLDVMLPKLGLLSGGFVSLATSAGSAVSNVISLGAGLAQIGPGAIALPGIFGGIAIAAVETSVALAAASKEIPDVISAYSKLSDVIQSNFWATAQRGIEQVTRNALPALRNGLAESSSQLGSLFATLSRSLDIFVVPKLPTMFSRLSLAIEDSKGFVDGLAKSIGVLGYIGSGVLPQLAEWASTISQQFANFLDLHWRNGDFADWIDNAESGLKSLASIAQGALSIVGGIGTAMQNSGGATLGALADGLQSVADVVNSPDFQRNLTGTFRAIHDSMSNILDGLGPALNSLFQGLSSTVRTVFPQVTKQIGNFLKGVGDALGSSKIQDGLKKLLTGFGDALDILEPVLQPVADKIGTLMSIVGRAFQDIAPLLVSVKDLASDLIETLAPGIISAMDSLTQGLGSALQDLAPFVSEIGKNVSKGLQAAGQAIGKILDKIGDSIKSLPPGTIDQIADNLGKLGNAVLDLALAIAPAVGPTIEFLSIFLGQAIAPLIDDVADAIEALAGSLDDLTGNLDFTKGMQKLRIFAGLFELVFSSLLDPVKAVAQGLLGLEQGIDTMFGGIINIIRGFFTGSVGLFVQGIGQVTVGILQEVGSVTTALTKVFLDPVKDIARVLAEQFEAMGDYAIAGFLRGIQDTFTEVEAQVTGFFTNIITWVKNLFGIHSPSTVFAEIGRNVVLGFINGAKGMLSGALQIFEQLATGVMQKLAGLPAATGALASKMRSQLSNAWSTIKTDASKGVSGIVSSVSSAFQQIPGRAGAALSALSGVVTGVIYSARQAAQRYLSGFGPMVSSTLAAAARAGSSFGPALRSAIGNVGRVLSDIRGEIQGAFSGASGWLRSAGSYIGQGLVNGIRSQVGAAAAAAASLAHAAVSAAQNKLEIASPSKVFKQIGVYVGEGFVAGMTSTTAKVNSTSKALANQVISAYDQRATALAESNKKIASLEKRRSDAEAKAGKASIGTINKLTSLEAQRATIEAKLSKIQTESNKKVTKSQAASLATQRLNAQTQLANVNKQIAATQKQAAAQVAASKKTAAALAASLTAQIKAERANQKSVKGLASASMNTVLNQITSTQKRLDDLANQRATIATKMKTAQDALTAALSAKSDFAAEVQQQLSSLSSITNFSTTLSSVITGLQNNLANLKKFASTLANLRKMGLSDEAYTELLVQGPDALSLAQAIEAGGKDAIKQINALQSQIDSQVNTLANSAASTLYDAGISMAQGVVKGLQSQDKQLAAAMTHIADLLVSKIKSELKIHSPSRLFADEVGAMIPAGIVAGVQSSSSSASQMIGSIVNTMTAGAIKGSRVSSVATQAALSSGLGGVASGGGSGPTINIYDNDPKAAGISVYQALGRRSLQ